MNRKRKIEIIVTLAVFFVFATVYVCSKIKPQFPPEFQLEKPFKTLKQPDSISCGPTSVTMLLWHYGKEVKFEDVKKQTITKWITLREKEIGMTAPNLITTALIHFGVPAKRTIGCLNELKVLVSQGRPCIVLLRSGPLLWHYVVVIGYTPQDVIIANPGDASIEHMPENKFLEAWNFVADMNGDVVRPQCPVCEGKGRLGKFNLGPLNRCDICAGSGTIVDVGKMAVRWLEVAPLTMIVPEPM